MATDDRDPDAPSLEPPSLGFRRKRREREPRATAPPPAAAPVRRPVQRPVEDTVVLAVEPDPTRDAPPASPRAPRRRPSVPVVTGLVAAALTGALVGLLGVGLTAGSMQACEAVRGTSTCGGGPGFTLLVLILVAMVLLGSALLRMLRVPDPGSTSFLAVGLLAVAILLFLVDDLFEWWMVVVVPVTAVATYVVAHRVATAVVEPARD